MSNIPFTADMGKWVVNACAEAGITKSALGTYLGHAVTFYCKKRSVISQQDWDETLAFLKKEGVKSAPPKGAEDFSGRFRALAAEPGSSPEHLREMFGLNKSMYYTLIKGEKVPGAQTQLILKKGFDKLNAEAKKLAKPTKRKSNGAPKKNLVLKPSIVQTVASVFRIQAKLRSLLNELPSNTRQEVMNELFAPEV